jgi:hypothetical protein
MDRACSLHGLGEEIFFGGGNSDEDNAFRKTIRKETTRKTKT